MTDEIVIAQAAWIVKVQRPVSVSDRTTIEFVRSLVRLAGVDLLEEAVIEACERTFATPEEAELLLATVIGEHFKGVCK